MPVTLVDEHPGRIRVFYLAVSPDLYGAVCAGLSNNDVINRKTRIVLEKPVGFSLTSAQLLNNQVGEVFSEEQIFRIDHYLGKETVQNLLALRFANSLFEPLWRGHYIDHVQSRLPKISASARAAGFTTRPAPCATWCKTTCCNCYAWWRWKRR